MKSKGLKLSFVGIALVMALIPFVILESALKPENYGSLLFNLTFWVTIVSGAIALVAAGILSNARWLLPVEGYILSLYPLFLFFALLFLLNYSQLSVYPWSGKGGIWLNEKFLLLRHLLLFILLFLLSRGLARGGKRRRTFATLYLLTYVTSMTLVAFDWVMSLEYPWYSTLFGGYFFIEGVFSGIAFAGILSGILSLRGKIELNTLRDTATMLFGFSLMWAGLLYAQYLVIWYGNIPEETSFLFMRFTTHPYKELSYVVLLMLFIGPFLMLLPKKSKESPAIVTTVGIFVLSGLFIERIVMLLPLLKPKFSVLSIEFFTIWALMCLLILNLGEQKYYSPLTEHENSGQIEG
jgi:hypothetical protein